MSDRAKVYVTDRGNAAGKTIYSVRWWSPEANRWRSKTIGTNQKRANHEAALIEKGIEAGTHCDLRSITWAAFVEEHVSRIPGKANAAEAKRTLDEFGAMFNNPALRRIRLSMIEEFVQACRTVRPEEPKSTDAPEAAKDEKTTKKKCQRKANTEATVAKKCRYLKSAFRAAIRRGYLGRSPMEGFRMPTADVKAIREVSQDEERALLDAAKELYGFRLEVFIRAALGTGARRTELTALLWERIDLDGGVILLTKTKARKDRAVPISPTLADDLRKLQVQTLKAGGPFIGMADNLGRTWGRIRTAAKVPDVSIHDMRRTFISRLLRIGTPLTTVQKLAGHANIKTTVEHYARTSDEDLRNAVENLHVAYAAG